MIIIDPSWIELQTGLYLEEQTRTVNGNLRTYRYLHSSDGYCFYDAEDEYYDEEGNLIPPENVLPEQRMYYQWASLAIYMSSWTYEQLNAKWISVPIEDGFEIANIGNETETI